MTRTLSAFDPINLIPPQPSRVENVVVSAHTEVTIPFLRAFSVFRVRLGRAAGVVIISGLALATAYWFVEGPAWAGWLALCALCIGVCVAWAAGPPFDSLERFQMGEISAPGKDTERQAIAEMVLEFLREQQQPVAQAPVLRVEAHMGGGRYRHADMPGPSRSAFVWLARDVVRGLPFALRTAIRQKYSRAQFDSLRDRFFEAGWAVWANEDAHAQGVLLTEEGMRVMQDAAASSLAEARRGC